MCKIISSDAVIGNFILESLERKYLSSSINKIVEYDKALSQKLESYNYFTKFDFDEVLNFNYNYPFFIKSIETDHIEFLDKSDDISSVINQLKRYFRIGMPTIVVNEMISASDIIFKAEWFIWK